MMGSPHTTTGGQLADTENMRRMQTERLGSTSSCSLSPADNGGKQQEDNNMGRVEVRAQWNKM